MTSSRHHFNRYEFPSTWFRKKESRAIWREGGATALVNAKQNGKGCIHLHLGHHKYFSLQHILLLKVVAKRIGLGLFEDEKRQLDSRASALEHMQGGFRERWAIIDFGNYDRE